MELSWLHLIHSLEIDPFAMEIKWIKALLFYYKIYRVHLKGHNFENEKDIEKNRPLLLPGI